MRLIFPSKVFSIFDENIFSLPQYPFWWKKYFSCFMILCKIMQSVIERIRKFILSALRGGINDYLYLQSVSKEGFSSVIFSIKVSYKHFFGFFHRNSIEHGADWSTISPSTQHRCPKNNIWNIQSSMNIFIFLLIFKIPSRK